MNKFESKYFNTAILFDEALIHLLEKKDIDYITVKEICNIAGLNRSTFYLHYESINDLVDETMEYITNKFMNYFDEDIDSFINKIDDCSIDELMLIKKKYLTPYLNFVKENQKIFLAAFNNPYGMRVNDRYDNLMKNILIPILNRFNILDKDKKYLINFYISGIMAIIKEWISNKCIDLIDDIENIIIKCVIDK